MSPVFLILFFSDYLKKKNEIFFTYDTPSTKVSTRSNLLLETCLKSKIEELQKYLMSNAQNKTIVILNVIKFIDLSEAISGLVDLNKH